ncbi:cytochrome P450 family protein [Rhizoctonia solani]|uniref:Cytochrome P450 n=1 Tax=Rhizoctonia solani TaxID=456999 RepID=A0A8H7HH93_9AGAM|nr:cytochrome P450 family protein [Rhizoctonia solani]KAF8686403.1 cytochrome P450 [Rhizoctonia solani]QRW20936.1 cytochrome P450 family protein [Rhizoctonia solani]
MEYYAMLKGFGNNILIVEGEEWKRQRRIVSPAFSDKNNHLVWEAAQGFVEQMMDSWGSRQSTILHDVSEDLSLPLSICVIAKAGLGQNVSWGRDRIPSGHTLTFKDALATFAKTAHLPLILPDWAWSLRRSWNEAKHAHGELRLYLQEMLNGRRGLSEGEIRDAVTQKHDLFSQLLYARDADNMLEEDELIGNVFIFLIAGHETTAHTLAIILALLALYPQAQDKIVKQVRELEHEYGKLSYSHIHQLTYTMAVIYETLRLFPTVPMIPKMATADTTLMVGLPPDNRTIHVPKSMTVHIQLTGLHYNPSYWESPEEFDPERFMDPHWNRDAFIAFSLGPRACIGRRFAETSLVAELVTLLSNYKVSIDESRFRLINGESIVERRSRLINPNERITLTPAPMPLVFSRRD